MTVIAPLLALLLTAPSPRAPRPTEGNRLEVGTRLFNSGDFEAALRALDAAALEGGEPATLEKVHLLRAQCYAARQDFGRAEEAFGLALDANPEATLDPGRVDPVVVKLLESVRARLAGTVVVVSSPAGATVAVDGQARGPAPLSLQLPIGRHKLEARWAEGDPAVTEVQVRPRREVRVECVQGPTRRVEVVTGPESRKLGPVGDFRFAPEFSTTETVDPTLPLEVGGGIEISYFRVTLGVRLYPAFGLIPRFTFALPVMEMLSVVIEAGVPFIFTSSVALGLSGGAGVEVYPVRWFGGFLLLGGRHYFLHGTNDVTGLTTTVGIRLRMP